MASQDLSLKECAERLGVHYMTAYRYVRLGMLPAEKVGSEWQVTEDDLEAFRHRQDPVSAGRRRQAPWADRLRRRMLAGDDRGSWQIVEAALASGLDPGEVYLDVITPAMHRIGEDWAAGSGTIAQEHRATAVATRLIGRLSSRFTHRGRSRGRVVIGTPHGEAHALAVSMVADLLRGAGFDVVDLGHDLPTEEFIAAVDEARPVAAVAVSISTSDSLPAAEELISALHAAAGVPVVVGGMAVVDEAQALALGADAYAADGSAAVAFVESLVSG